MQELNYWQRLSRKKLSRRRVLAAGATAAAGLAAGAIVGCGGGGSGTGNGPKRTPGPPRSPVAGGSITQGRLVGALGIDPHVDLTALDIDYRIYSYMYSWRPNAEEVILNNLALEMETPDPLTMLFKLRPGVRIHPGGDWDEDELVSTDYKRSFDRRGQAVSAPDKRFYKRIVRMETPDKYTFNVYLSRPFAPAIRELANPTWAIISEKVIEKHPQLSQKAFGTGPFMLEEMRGNERIVIKKFPNYFLNPPRPYLDGITYIIIPDNSSARTAFESGQHDVNGAFLQKPDAEDLMKSGNYTVMKAPWLFYPVIHLKVHPTRPFYDIRVREAIDLALDRDQFMLLNQDGEGNYNGPIQWAQTKWALPQEELRAFYKYDPERAKQLLAEAGYPNGFSVKMKIPKLVGPTFIADGAFIVKDQLAKVGINVEVIEVELGTFIGSTIIPGNFDMAFFPNLPYDEPDRPLAFYHSLGVTGSGNWTNYTNPELDKLIDAQAEEFDEEKRKQIILEAQRMILKEHGPQLTLTGGYFYSARWWYVHYPWEIGQDPPKDVGPEGTDIWTEENA